MKLWISSRTATFLLVVGSLAFGFDAVAFNLEYELDLPADRRLSYQVEFEVTHPGPVRLYADWEPSRVLVFRLEGPDGQTMRRTGTPPQSMAFEVGAEDAGADSRWTLKFSGLPARRASAGRLWIELPDSPAIRERNDRAVPADVPEAPPPPPWLLPARKPPGLSAEGERVFESTERFRQLVADGSAPDACRWQADTLRYLATQRDRAVAGEPPLSLSTRNTFLRIVEMTRELDRLREIEGIALPGPTPTDAVKRRAWETIRHPHFTPVEDELDAVMIELERGHLPELEREKWISAFMSCLLVCERHFEERARLGEDRASNPRLTRQQWDRILAATEALDALTSLPLSVTRN